MLPAGEPKFRRRKADRPDEILQAALDVFAHKGFAAAQARGEIRPGDPRAYALSLASAMLIGLIWNETFAPGGAPPFDVPALARQHVETVLAGMLTDPGAAS